MYDLPKEPGKLRERIRRYQRKFREEKSRRGTIHDGAGKRYLDEIPPDFFSLWDEDALKWAAGLYDSEEFRGVASRYIEIHRELLDLPPGPIRTRLVREAFALKE